MVEQNEELRKFNYIMGEIDGEYHNLCVSMEISDSVFNILYFIYDQGDGASQSQIVKYFGTSRKTVNSAIHKMVTQGLITLSDKEGRNKKIYLTKEGRKLADSIIPDVVAAENDALNSWSEGDKEIFLRMLNDYKEHVRKNFRCIIEERGGLK